MPWNKGRSRRKNQARTKAAVPITRRASGKTGRDGTSRAGTGRRNRSATAHRRKRTITAKLFAFGWRLGAAGLVAALMLFLYVGFTVPIPERGAALTGQVTVRILDRNGELIAERGQHRRFVPIERIPVHLVDAVLATEDRRFFSHWGVDPLGLIRAAFANVLHGRVVEGGSTLTQQLAKNLYLGSERTLSRKFTELALALWLELRLSKREILEAYLNRVYFGSGAYGVEAAAQRYFGTSVDDLTLAQAAMLAGLLKAPTFYSPDNDPVIAHMRSGEVLSRMVAAGTINEAERSRAVTSDLALVDKAARLAAGYAADWVFDLARERLAAPLVSSPSRPPSTRRWC